MLAVDPRTATRRRSYPSISLLVPLDGPTPWRARLRRLRREAIARLRDELGRDLDEQLLHRLHEAVNGATAPVGARSLAVYVNGDGFERVGLAVAVRERAVIDDTFATRDLVHHDLRSPRYWVLALSLDEPRLLHGHGATLYPRALPLRDVVEHPSSDRSRRGRDRSDVIDARRTRRLRAIDLALGEAIAGSPDPLIAVGADPTLARFLERTRHIDRIEGVVRRAPGNDLAQLAQLVAPSVADVLDERRTLALAALDRAVGAGTAASGIDQVWRHARRAPGLLLVEQGFEHPAELTDEGTLEAAVDAAAAGVIDDAVDEVIEHVLAAGGRVEILPDGALAAHQRIALTPARRTR